jgi:hypothetical protein
MYVAMTTSKFQISNRITPKQMLLFQLTLVMSGEYWGEIYKFYDMNWWKIVLLTLTRHDLHGY